MNKNTEMREITFFLFMTCFIVCLAVNTREAISRGPSGQKTLTLSHNVCKHSSRNPEEHPIATKLSTADQTLHKKKKKTDGSYTVGANASKWKQKIKINVRPRSGSVQNLLDAPAAQEEIQALFDRLDKTVGEISTQEVLAPSETHGHVP